ARQQPQVAPGRRTGPDLAIAPRGIEPAGVHMSTVQISREARQAAPPIDKGELPLLEPPVLPEITSRNFNSMLIYMPMMIGSMAMMLFYVQPGGRSTTMLLVSGGIMVGAIAVMGGAMVMRAGSDRKLKLRAERRDYLRYLGQARRQVRKSVDKQRTSM